jgi:methylase of polypeptide subunit release factors
LIISNPPYIPSAEIATLQPEVRDFDPRAALDGGADGLDFYRLLAAEAKPFLKPGGKIMLEFGDGQAGPSKKFLKRKVDCRSGEGRLQSARQNFKSLIERKSESRTSAGTLVENNKPISWKVF